MTRHVHGRIIISVVYCPRSPAVTSQARVQALCSRQLGERWMERCRLQPVAGHLQTNIRAAIALSTPLYRNIMSKVLQLGGSSG